MADYLHLKNGTDIRGTAIAGENDPVTLTDEALSQIAKAFCVWLNLKKHIARPRIAIGHDSRLSAEHIVSVLAENFTACGSNVILTGLSSTPSMFMLLQDDFGADASVMVTASHMPPRKNGLKFFVKEGGLESSDIKEILSLAGEGINAMTISEHPTVTKKSYIEKYSADLVNKVRIATGEEKPLSGKRILVDAGNGAGGFYEKLVLRPLGADTTGSQFLEPDGNFPNHIPNPEDKEAMHSISEAVKRNHADFGIIFDTDVDRAGAVSSHGEEINRNRLIALISAILLKEQTGGYIVTDSVTSDGLSEFINAHGGVHHRFKRGYKNVINECKRLNAEGNYSPLAIETSGHAALKENYFLDDGAYLITRLLIALAKASKENKDLLELISDLNEPKEAREIRLSFNEPALSILGYDVIEKLKEQVQKQEGLSLAPDNYEGVRINFDKAHGDGWALLRMSLHDPIMPLNVESNSAGGCNIILAQLSKLLEAYDFLNLEPLKS